MLVFNRSKPSRSFLSERAVALRRAVALKVQPVARPASPPPFGERCDILNSLRASNFAWLPPAVRSNCSEAICLAARTLFLEAFLRSAVIFVKCRKVSTRTTLPNFIDLSAETALYSRFGGHNGRRS